ncbi:MAG: protein kinase [Synechococcales bacterium]|nr:protein kinase [Synechococcales bacterium]
MTLTTGATLQGGRYTIQEILSHTPTEVTYRAIHQLLDQPVLIKTLRVEAFEEDIRGTVQANFAIAASRFAQCVHPHLARVVDCFYEAETPYLVWETVAGESLRSRLETHTSADLPVALRELRELVGAVQQLHDHRLVHGAIAPDAIYYRPQSGEAMLTNVDLAGALPPLSGADPTGVKADLRGLALVFYSRLIGEMADGTLLGTAQSLPVLQVCQPDLPTAVESAILVGLNPHVPDAPTSVSAWLTRIETALGNVPEPSTPPTCSDSSLDLGWPAYAVAEPPAMSQPELLQLSIFSPEDGVASSEVTSEDWILENPACRLDAHAPAAPVAPAAREATDSPKAGWRSPRWMSLFTRTRSWVPATLGLTAIAAAFGGGYLGLALRLQDADQLESTPILGSEIFGRDQAFPPTDNWPTPSRQQRAATEEVLFEPAAPDLYAPSRPGSGRDSTVHALEETTPRNNAVADPELLTNLESEADENFSDWEMPPLVPGDELLEVPTPPVGTGAQPGDADAPSRKKPAPVDGLPPILTDPALGDRPPVETPLSPNTPSPEPLPASDASSFPTPTVVPATPLPDFEPVPQDVSQTDPAAPDVL